MKFLAVFISVLYFVSRNLVVGVTSEETAEVSETCCTHGKYQAMGMASPQACSSVTAPEDVEREFLDTCVASAKSCCEEQFLEKDDCIAGIKMAPKKQCAIPKTDIGKTCCDECSFGRWSGESQGKEACGSPAEDGMSPQTTLRKNAFYQCCLEATKEPETTTETTTENKIETTTEMKKEEKKEKCQKDSCDHICKDDDGKVTCQCRKGFRLQSDNKTCKDINECREILDDLCTEEDTVCHNTVGSFKCVPIKKRDVSLSCPPGFKRNVLNQVCDDINECQLPRPPCPKYLCENTIGGYKCAGKPGKPFTEAIPGVTTEAEPTTPTTKNDICPPGFRAGPNDECLDIDECEERLDDCQRLSQHCINTHGSYFCQDHVSKRCAPGFKVNAVTGICEDIDECEESSEVCKRTEVCVNLPGAYNCKSKISTLPQLAKKTCQEGTRQRPGATICEDIDECREGTHLCDRFQNCINTYGGHECRCKNGFELDSSSGSCVDIDECALKLDNCQAGLHCLNVLGSFTCTRRPATTSTTTTAAPPVYDYEYYDSEEENTTNIDTKPNTSVTIPTTSTSTTSTTPGPTTTSTTSTTSTTTPIPSTTTTRTTRVWPPSRPGGYNPYYPRYLIPTTRRTPYTNPPVRPTRPTTPESRRPENRPRRPETLNPVEVTVPNPTNVVTIEKEKEADGSYGLNASEIPKDKWMNVIGVNKPETLDFNPEELHCLNGFERSPSGDCIDINECETGRHICSSLEVCHNRQGGYMCDCMPGFHRDPSGWCVVATTTSTTTTSTTTTTTPRPMTVRTTTSTTESTTAVTTTSTVWPRVPRPRLPWYTPSKPCDFGYIYSSILGKCVDIDECAANRANCSPKEDCVNTEGGYRCVCGKRCRAETETPTFFPSAREPPAVLPDTNVITVGAQYGQRGARVMRPTYSRSPSSAAVITSCPWGYKLTPEKHCVDIDECARNISECGPQQRCENFFGGYSCQCPAGHRLVGQQRCEDIDECAYGNPCSYNAQCINTVGSYRCSCGDGFRNAPSNDKVCVDVDECAETPHVCAHGCANAWGGYRCYCERGYRLHADNRTCVDVDECAEWGAVRARGRLCGGRCVNVPGSYRCACPPGYRLADDSRACTDIDECETGEAHCAGASDEGLVCQNTRGGYHCHRIDCPPGYRLESKHKCTRIQRSCPISDWNCIQQPSALSYNFITFVANIYLPTGSVDLFTMHGPSWRDSVVNFEMRMVDVKAPSGVKPADLSCFDMRPSANVCVVSLLCSLEGPQVAELELTMSLYQRSQFAGSAVARLVVIVSEYEF